VNFLGDEQRIERLEHALLRFYVKAQEVSKAVEGAIVMDALHGQVYTGPTFIDNFLEVEQLLCINPERAPGVPIGHET
jgi:hypothetical protein